MGEHCPGSTGRPGGGRGPDQGGCARALYGVGVGAGEQHREGGESVRRRAPLCWAALLWPKDREAVRLVP